VTFSFLRLNVLVVAIVAFLKAAVFVLALFLYDSGGRAALAMKVVVV
jgi:hypothetical protein